MQVQRDSSSQTQFPEERYDPIINIPLDISYEIFRKLDNSSINNCRQVSKTWKKVADNDSVQNSLRQANIKGANIIGAKEWSELLGADVGKEPPISRQIHGYLESPCPLSNDKKAKVKDTHLLLLIPETINKKPLNLKTLIDLVKPKFSEFGISNFKIDEKITKSVVNNDKSRWVLITKNILEDSKNRSYSDQEKLVADKGQGKYEIPSLLDMTIFAFMECASKTERQTHLFENTKIIFIRCRDKFTESYGMIGNTLPFFAICLNKDTAPCIGVTAIRRFLKP